MAADDWFRSSCLKAQQLLMGLPGRPRMAHEDGTIVHAQIAGLVQFRPARASWLSGLLCLDKYHPTTSSSFATHMEHLASSVKPLVYRNTTGLGAGRGAHNKNYMSRSGVMLIPGSGDCSYISWPPRPE